jgi:hypothetical protein
MRVLAVALALAAPAARNMLATFVMVRNDGQWRISAIRNMLAAVPTP